MLNLATTQGIKGNDVLKYVSACFSVFCEYFQHANAKIKNAAYSALRLLVQQGLKKEYFANNGGNNKSNTQEILSLDALTLNEEISNMRKGAGGRSGVTNADKIVIHMRYLLTSRFDDSQEQALKLMKAFIQTVGSAVPEAPELLVVVAGLKTWKESYQPWISCLGSFFSAIG